MLLDQREQLGGIGRVQADAAMRGRAAERADGGGAVDGIAAAEEHRIGHRATIFARIPAALEPGRAVDAIGRAEALAPGRDRPVVDLAVAGGDAHALGGDVDADIELGLCRSDTGERRA
jgi:hypothetical protein